MKLLKTAWFRSIKTKLLLVLLMFIVPAVIASTLITYRLFLGALQQQNEETTTANFTRIEERINDLLENANLAVSAIQKYPDVDNYLLNAFSSDIEKTIAKQKMIAAIDKAFTPYDYLNAVIFFQPDGSMYGSSLPQTFFYEKRRHPFVSTPAYARAEKNSSGVTWIGGYTQNYFSQLPQTRPLTSSDIMICGLKTIHYSFSYYTPQENSLKNITVLFSIDEAKIRQTFDYIADKNSYVCLLDASGGQLSGGQVSLFGKAPWYYGKIDPESKFGSITVSGSKDSYQVIYHRMNMTDWLLVEITPLKYYRSKADSLRIAACIIGIGMVIVIGSLYLVWTYNFIKPIKRIILSIEKVKNGDLSIRIKEKGNTAEFELMSRQFNQMLDSINDLIKRTEQMEREEMNLEMRSLQYQINPHFIYNTITAIRWVATISGSKNVADMLVVFIGLLRPVFSQREPEWPLADEIEFIENYITLMKLRFGNTVTVDINIPGEMRRLPIPRFILQPLLENCFEHGVTPEKVIRVGIDIKQEHESIIIRVCDDGKGISDQQLREINKKLAAGSSGEPETQDDHASVGLANVHRRLQLYYGSENGLTVENTLGGGMSITIRAGIRGERKT